MEHQTDVCNLVNDTGFRKLTQIDQDYYEVEMAKSKIGYWILQLAKLRMIEFYYDLDRYCDRSDFEYIAMNMDMPTWPLA